MARPRGFLVVVICCYSATQQEPLGGSGEWRPKVDGFKETEESTDDLLQLRETDAHGMQQIQQMMVEPWQKFGWTQCGPLSLNQMRHR